MWRNRLVLYKRISEGFTNYLKAGKDKGPPYVKTFSLAFIGLAVYSEIITDSQVSQRKRGGMSMLTLLIPKVCGSEQT